MTDHFSKLVELAREFRCGKAGVHFLVESDEEGFGFKATPLECRLIELGARVRDEIASDPGILTGCRLALAIKAMADMGPGTGQVRARLLAQGGDYCCQDSPARDFIVEGIELIRSALAVLAKRGLFPLEDVPECDLLSPVEIRAFHGSDSRPFIERLFAGNLEYFRRPRIAGLVKSLLNTWDHEAAREASRARKLANYKRTIIDDGRDGLIPEPEQE